MIGISVETTAPRELVDVTDAVVSAVRSLGLDEGAVLVSSPHTTAGVIVNEGYDPDVAGDLVRRLERLAPREGQGDRHAEGNSDAARAEYARATAARLPRVELVLRQLVAPPADDPLRSWRLFCAGLYTSELADDDEPAEGSR